jgi:hypothetical protein
MLDLPAGATVLANYAFNCTAEHRVRSSAPTSKPYNQRQHHKLKETVRQGSTLFLDPIFVEHRVRSSAPTSKPYNHIQHHKLKETVRQGSTLRYNKYMLSIIIFYV